MRVEKQFWHSIKLATNNTPYVLRADYLPVCSLVTHLWIFPTKCSRPTPLYMILGSNIFGFNTDVNSAGTGAITSCPI